MNCSTFQCPQSTIKVVKRLGFGIYRCAQGQKKHAWGMPAMAGLQMHHLVHDYSMTPQAFPWLNSKHLAKLYCIAEARELEMYIVPITSYLWAISKHNHSKNANTIPVHI